MKENEVVQEDDDSEVEEEKVLKEEIESEDCQRRGRKRASTCPKSGISPLNLLFGSLIPNTPVIIIEISKFLIMKKTYIFVFTDHETSLKTIRT